jgi:hypothetical protein
MKTINNKFGKFFGPSFTWTGYMLLAAGLIAMSYSFISLILIIPGLFVAFTYTGTLIDPVNKKVRSYTALFGLIRVGKWIGIDKSSDFTITKVRGRYTSYSRGNQRLDINIDEIRLLVVNKEKGIKIVLKKFKNFEEAREEMEKMKEIFNR